MFQRRVLRISRPELVSGQEDATAPLISVERTKSTQHDTPSTRQLQGVHAGTAVAFGRRLDSHEAVLEQPIAFRSQNVASPAPHLLAQQTHRMFDAITFRTLLINCLKWHRHLNQPGPLRLSQCLPTTRTTPRTTVTNRHRSRFRKSGRWQSSTR